jgi:hypothetical protein
MDFKQWGKNARQFVSRKPVDSLLILLFIVVIIKLTTLYFSVSVDDGNWEQFKAEHECQLRTNESGTQRSSWKCNDGEIYYRWRQQR